MLRGNEAISFTPPTTDNYRVIPSASQIASVGCEYWITRDASWSIAQFACATATPPQYRNDDCSTGE